MNIEKLIEAYRQAAIHNSTASREGDYRTANRAHDTLVQLSHHFRRGGQDMQRSFLALLADEDFSVRAWAATHALEFAPQEAVRVLHQLQAEAPWPINLGAKVVLEEWEAGTLQLP